jgi:hypothetical protein
MHMRISVVPGQLAYPLPERVGGWPGAPARPTTCRNHPAYIPRRAAAPSRSASYALRACTVRSSQIRDSYQRWGLYGAAVAGHRLLMVLRGHLRGTTRQGPLAVSSEPARLPAGRQPWPEDGHGTAGAPDTVDPPLAEPGQRPPADRLSMLPVSSAKAERQRPPHPARTARRPRQNRDQLEQLSTQLDGKRCSTSALYRHKTATSADQVKRRRLAASGLTVNLSATVDVITAAGR